MASFKCDTDRLEEDGRKIIKIINDYQRNINDFFRELQDLTVNRVWNGNNADRYTRMIASDKQEYVNFGNAIREIGYDMIKFSDDLENKIRLSERENRNIR